MTKKQTKARDDRELTKHPRINPPCSWLDADGVRCGKPSARYTSPFCQDHEPRKTTKKARTNRDLTDLQASHDIKAENLEIVRKERDALRKALHDCYDLLDLSKPPRSALWDDELVGGARLKVLVMEKANALLQPETER